MTKRKILIDHERALRLEELIEEYKVHKLRCESIEKEVMEVIGYNRLDFSVEYV